MTKMTPRDVHVRETAPGVRPYARMFGCIEYEDLARMIIEHLATTTNDWYTPVDFNSVTAKLNREQRTWKNDHPHHGHSGTFVSTFFHGDRLNQLFIDMATRDDDPNATGDSPPADPKTRRVLVTLELQVPEDFKDPTVCYVTAEAIRCAITHANNHSMPYANGVHRIALVGDPRIQVPAKEWYVVAFTLLDEPVQNEAGEATIHAYSINGPFSGLAAAESALINVVTRSNCEQAFTVTLEQLRRLGKNSTYTDLRTVINDWLEERAIIFGETGDES